MKRHEFKEVSISNFFKKINNQNNLIFKNMCGEIQRKIDIDHLNELIQYQKNYYKKYNEFIFPNPIILCKINDKFAVIDGQHRIQCIKTLFNEYNIDFNIMLSIITIDNINEYDELFLSVNLNKPVVLFKNITDWKTVGKYIEEYFLKNYNIYNKNSENPRIPHINFQNMLKYINENNIIEKCNLNKDEFINEIIELNNYYSGINGLSKFTEYIQNYSTLLNKCKEKQPNNPLYLGIYKNFEWIESIVYKINNKLQYHQMNHISLKYNHIKIKKPLKKLVWTSFNDKSLEGKCYVCSRNIDYDTFECGHIISVFKGGTTTLTNLKPICSSCNKDMGVHNLEEYKSSFNNETK